MLGSRPRAGVCQVFLATWCLGCLGSSGASPQMSLLTPATILQKTGRLWTTSSRERGCVRVMGVGSRHRKVFCGWRLRRRCLSGGLGHGGFRSGRGAEDGR